MKDKVEKKDGDKLKRKPCHKNEDGADKLKGKDRNKSKENGKSGANSKGKKTTTKSSISAAGMKSDREKCDSGQNKNSK